MRHRAQIPDSYFAVSTRGLLRFESIYKDDAVRFAQRLIRDEGLDLIPDIDEVPRHSVAA